jgi:hypothetical protein
LTTASKSYREYGVKLNVSLTSVSQINNSISSLQNTVTSLKGKAEEALNNIKDLAGQEVKLFVDIFEKQLEESMNALLPWVGAFYLPNF